MKKLFITICCLIFCFCSPKSSFAALGAATVWEVRTTGNANNGGGFDSGVAVPGTDYSQQDAAQYSGTDLACADGDAATPSVTSATHNFVEADEGNIINITEAGTGFTLGRYVITDTAANAATLDRACGADGALTGGDWYLGGAVAAPWNIDDVVVADNKIWVQKGTYSGTTWTTSTNAGYNHSITWEGYDTTRGDAPLSSANMPKIDGQNARACSDFAGSNHIFKYFWFYDGLTYGADSKDAWGNVFIHCIASSCTTSGFYHYPNTQHVDCEAYSNGIGFIGVDDAISCYAHDNTSHGFSSYNSTSGVGAWRSISDTNGGDGFNGTRYFRMYDCVAYNNTDDGFEFSAGGSASDARHQIAINCIASTNGDYGFIRSSATAYPLLLFNCLWDSNGNTVSGVVQVEGNSTSDPSFTNAAGGDFTLQSGSGALATGFPQAIMGATGDYQWNIGVDQDDNTAAGGGNVLIIEED